MDLTPTPILLGVLYDFPQGDHGAAFESALRLGLQACTPRSDRPIEFLPEHTRGLPIGSEHELRQGFDNLVGKGALMIVGPSISDNALIAAPLADQHRIAAINYSGGERTRSEWMLHFQLGSLEEEPAFIARRIAELGHTRAAVVFDASPVGQRYMEYFEASRVQHGIEVTARASISPLTEHVDQLLADLARSEPDVLVYLGLGLASRAVAVARVEQSWNVPVIANSALMFGYIRPDWREAFAGWEYVDTISDHNAERATLAASSAASAAGPIGCAAYDIGRLIGTALDNCDHLTRAGVLDALRRVKRLPAATGMPGTLMGFGQYDHAALKGEYLVLREWRDGRTQEVARR